MPTPTETIPTPVDEKLDLIWEQFKDDCNAGMSIRRISTRDKAHFKLAVKKYARQLERENILLRQALEHYATCSDLCTCGDGWSHSVARKALDSTVK